MRPAALAAPLLFAACSSQPVPAGLAAFTTRLLDTIPSDTNVVLPASFSRDGQRVAWVARRKEGDYAVCGDWRGKTYAVV